MECSMRALRYHVSGSLLVGAAAARAQCPQGWGNCNRNDGRSGYCAPLGTWCCGNDGYCDSNTLFYGFANGCAGPQSSYPQGCYTQQDVNDAKSFCSTVVSASCQVMAGAATPTPSTPPGTPVPTP